jgi:nucleoside 2-deoxyribosyltransferase
MAVSSAKCPLCCIAQPFVSTSSGNDGQTHVSCKRCGDFVFCAGAPENWDIPPIPRFILDKGVKRADHDRGRTLFKTYLSIYTRECSESSRLARLPSPFSLKALETLAETYANTVATAKPDKLLRLLERRTAFPGSLASFNPELDFPAVNAISAGEFLYYVDALANQGLIETPSPTKDHSGKYPESVSPDAAYGATITLAGWAKLGATGANSHTGFIAMSFDPSLNKAFSEGIEPAIREAHYEPLRVDKIHHNEKICDRIVAEIRRSRFVVADVTMQRQGVYFEAGFAMALALPVIWCCRKDDLNNVHFDTRQYNHIVWEQPADLRQRLADRIRATIGAAR